MTPSVGDILNAVGYGVLLPAVVAAVGLLLALHWSKGEHLAVLAGLFDCALGVAGSLQYPTRRVGTCELSLKFMRAVFDTPVDVFGACVKKTDTLAFVESELYSGGKLCALASGMVAVASDRGDEQAVW